MNHDISRLRALIAPPDGGGQCNISDDTLAALLMRYPCYELAAYHACLMLARDDSLTLPDGTQLPSQREYWLSRAAALRPSHTGGLRRADDFGRGRRGTAGGSL